jgi:ribosomal protein HS6-type (S12/L30/L7a)
LNNKLLSFLGLCRRAGKMTIGNDAVIEEINNGKSCLVLLAGDASQRTAREAALEAEKNNVEIRTLSCSKQQLSQALGRLTAVISIHDAGFAKKLMQLADDE